jgi:type II secretory pathway predicted ATPase ExeA
MPSCRIRGSLADSDRQLISLEGAVGRTVTKGQRMNSKLLALYGLKWNPFSPELPTEAIYVPPRIENFCWRIEHAQIKEGGFALIHGDPGTGKSIAALLNFEWVKRHGG